MLIRCSLSYHVIQGTYLADAIPENITFVPTLLQNQPQFANVSGGQRLGVQRAGQNVTIFSGALANSSVTQAVSYYQVPYETSLTRSRTSTSLAVSSMLSTDS